ncbi:MAG TPA: hypothetical protein VF075_04625 [Pyrinomonadaceae bacterium]
MSRTLSLVIAVIYLLVVGFSTQPRSLTSILGDLLLTAAALLLPLACIWFGDEMGNYVRTVRGPAINKPSPGWMVKLGGWVLLLLPVVIGGFIYAAAQ